MTYYDGTTGLFYCDGGQYSAEDLLSPDCDIPLLRKHLEWVETQSELPYDVRDWNQGVWARLTKEENVCRTYRCFAGNVVHEAGGKFVTAIGMISHVIMPDSSSERPIESAAAEKLGINRTAARLLFDESNTAADMRRICEAIAGEPL